MGCWAGTRRRSKGERREDDMSVALLSFGFFFLPLECEDVDQLIVK